MKEVTAAKGVQSLQLTQDFPLATELCAARWRPAKPKELGHDTMILMPGFTAAFWMQVFNRSYSTISAWRATANASQSEIQAAMCELMPADGLAMARLPGPCQLPFWSRLAIAHYRKVGHSVPVIAESFECCSRTVSYVLSRTQFANPERRLTVSQRNPPSRWSSAKL